MQTQVERLRVTLGLLQMAVPKKPTLPVLKNVLLRDGKAVANDLEASISLDFPEAEGTYLLPHHPVSELLKYVPGDEMLTIEQAEKNLSFVWEGGKASFDVALPGDYPEPSDVVPTAEGTIDGDRLVAALTSIVSYCSKEEARAMLTGITVSLGETTEVFAGDGFRMAYQILPLPFPAEARVTIPSHSIGILSELWSKAPRDMPLQETLVGQVTAKRPLKLTLGKEDFVASFGRVTLTSKLIAGTAPNFRKVIPKDPPLKVMAFAPELERAVQRVKEIARDGSGIVRFVWTDSTMVVSAKSEELGSAEAEVKVQTEGGEGKVAIGVGYLLDYLKGREGLVRLEVTDEKSPVLLRHGTTSPLVVIMPMHVDW